MTSSLPRGRPRRPGPHISVRVAHALLGCAIGLVWLVLPGMTSRDDAPVAIKEPASAPSSVAAAVEEEDETSAADLVLPLVAVAAVGALAGYGYVRRVRRARSRTTPGGSADGPPPPRSAIRPLAALDERACAALVEADDRIRATRIELDYVDALFGGQTVAPLRRTVEEAGAELAAAFRMRRRYDEGTPAEEAPRTHALAGIVGRCEETTRRLDSVADALGRLRGPDGGPDAALGVAEGRFRELTGLVAASETVLADLRTRYAPTATASVVGNVEQAKDRLLFATVRLNEARQSADSGRAGTAAAHLRAAEAAVAQAAVLLGGVDRLAALLKAAEQTAPAALTGAEAELSAARADEAAATAPGAHAQLRHADAVLASVRQELTAGRPWDPVDVLRRIVRATEPFAPVRGGVLPAAALIAARAATGTAADFVETHRGVVGAAARTRLAEAERLLAANDPADRRAADDLALESWELAGQDVRTHGNPGPAPEGATGESGAAGAALGGIVPPGPAPDGTHTAPAAPQPGDTDPPPGLADPSPGGT
ncbi:hypothetical protein ABT300_05865 [Streptomyces sp. NPDC001027]|uniref:hypothetical protein n=1 Tax=Streptomyces sp. NPDC001027 TaxID=3154771 RepID=UPI0033259C90